MLDRGWLVPGDPGLSSGGGERRHAGQSLLVRMEKLRSPQNNDDRFVYEQEKMGVCRVLII